MDNPNSNNDENKWVEDRIANLLPPVGWKPDPDRAFERVMQRQPTTASRSLRLLMAGATLAVVALVVTALPWQMLWTPKKGESVVAAQQTEPPVQANPDPPKTEPVATPPTQQPVSKDDKQDLYVGEKDANAAKPPATIPQPDPQTTPRRPKKEPRIIAGDIAPEPGPSSPLLAGVTAQGQGQPSPPPPASVTEPVLVSQIQPAYTPEAREAKVQGTIEINALIRDDGTVKVEKIVRGLGYGLDEAAIAAVEQWKFIPGKKDGKPVNVLTNILVNFALR